MLTHEQKRRLLWTGGITLGTIALIGTVAAVASAKTSTSSTGTSTDVIPPPPPNPNPAPPPPPPPASNVCAMPETPSPNCQECAPSEVDAAVTIADDHTKASGQQYNVFVQASGHHIVINKSSPGFAQIVSICLDANQSAQPTDIVL